MSQWKQDTLQVQGLARGWPAAVEEAGGRGWTGRARPSILTWLRPDRTFGFLEAQVATYMRFRNNTAIIKGL